MMERVSVSIGHSIKSNEESIYELIKYADQSMYAEKRKVSNDYSKELMKTINVKGFIR